MEERGIFPGHAWNPGDGRGVPCPPTASAPLGCGFLPWPMSRPLAQPAEPQGSRLCSHPSFCPRPRAPGEATRGEQAAARVAGRFRLVQRLLC